MLRKVFLYRNYYRNLVQLKILFLLPRFPYPLYKGDQLRAFYQMRELSLFHEVSVFALTDKEISSEDKQKISFVKNLNVFVLNKKKIVLRLFRQLFSREPFQVAYFYDLQAQKTLNDFILTVKPDIIFCQLVRMAKYCRDLPHPAKILDYQDAFSAGLKRRIQNSNFFYRFLIREEYKRMLNYEEEVFGWFELKTIISSQDRDLISHPLRDEIKVLPNGVDSNYFSPSTIPIHKSGLLFTGNMAYPPNIQCVQYLVKSVLPLLPEKYTDCILTIAGANPSPKVIALESKNVVVTGKVPDLLPYYRQALIFTAPMLTGIGMQNKLLEAMSSGLVCITSSLANNAIQATHEVHLFVCDSPESVAETIVMLLNNPQIGQEIGQNAKQFIAENYTWQAQNQKLIHFSTKILQKQ